MSLIPCAKNRRQRGLADFWKKFSFRKADKLSITDESCWLDNYCICFLSVIKWIQTSPFTLHTSLSKRRQYLNSANDPGLLSLQLPELLLHRLSTIFNIGSAVQCSPMRCSAKQCIMKNKKIIEGPLIYSLFPNNSQIIYKLFLFLFTVSCKVWGRGFFRRADSFAFISRQGMTSLDLCLQLIPSGQRNPPRRQQPVLAGLASPHHLWREAGGHWRKMAPDGMFFILSHVN